MWEKRQIFLSYAREDQSVISRIYRKLKAAGAHPWMDTEDIAPGEDWQEAINRAVAGSSLFLAFLSPRSVEKAGVLRREMELAREIRAKTGSSLKVIPVRIEPCEAPEVLRDLQWIDLFDPDGWDRLLREIRPRRRVTMLAASGVVLAVLGAAAFRLFSPACDFISARSSLRCSGQDAWVGATFWRLRPAEPSDPPQVRSIIQPPASQNPASQSGAKTGEAWTPVRLLPGSQMARGDRFYVSLESTVPGFLYVINREIRAGGRTGPAELIFPTLRTRQGDNRVEKDALVRLPAADDKPPYYEITGGDDGEYEGEIFTVVLLAKPLPGLETPADHAPVRPEDFARWQAAWMRKAAFASGTSAGGRITEREAKAHSAAGRIVQNSGDASPELIYRVTPGTEGGLWVDFPLRVRR